MPRFPSHLAGGTTGVGSLPHRIPEESVRVSLLPDLPYWPQLPQRSPNEGMLCQFATPGAPIMPDRAAGLYALAEALQDTRLPILKGQITGPVTHGSEPELWATETKRLTAKALWQVKWLQRWADQVVIVIDEPTIGDVDDGDRWMAADALRTMARALREAGALVGVHCCGEADWEWLASLDWDLLSFDALRRPPLGVLARQVRAGGGLIWGCVPTDREPDVPGILANLRTCWGTGALAPEQWHAAALISPACGLGTLPLERAERIAHQVQRVAQELRAELELRAAFL